MRVVFIESATKLTWIGIWLDSLLVQLKCTLEHECNPLQTYIGATCSIRSLPLHVGEREVEPPRHILCVD